MQNSMHRFRLPRVSNQLEIDASSPAPETEEGQRSDETRHAAKRTTRARTHDESARWTGPSACQRCRRFKKKCTRTEQGDCSSCIAASLPCSSVVRPSRGVSEKELRARIAWLSRYVNETLSHGSLSIESVETGNDISRLVMPLLDQSSTFVENEESTRVPSPVVPQHHAGVPVTSEYDLRGRNVAVPLETLLVEPIRATSRPSSSSEDGRRVSRLPQESAGRRFIDAYFRHIHLAYPFLDRSQVLAEVDAIGTPALQTGEDGIPTKLYVIMAIGCTTLQRAGQVGNEISSKFIISYSNIIHDCLRKNNVESVELLMLLALYSLFDPSGISTWAISGIVARQAISLGLTRNATSAHGLYSQQAELRNRLFWSVYVLDRVISASYGLPPSINDENIDIPLPGITVQEYASAERHYYTKALQVSRHIVALQQLEAKILQRIHFAPSHTTSELSRADKRAISQDLRTQIENWYKQGCVLSGSALPEQDNIPFHNTITWLNFRYQNLLVLLHCPAQFNSHLSVEGLAELRMSAQKYIQSSAILFQQRHLPLNWVMLCRFLAMGALLLHCFSKHRHTTNIGGGWMHCANCAQQQFLSPTTASSPHGPFEATAELMLCADILDLFPEQWQVARRSAAAFRRFAEFASSENAIFATNSSMSSPTSSEELSFRAIHSDIVALAKEVLGETSLYTVAAAVYEPGNELAMDWTHVAHHDYSNASAGWPFGTQPFSVNSAEGAFTLSLDRGEDAGIDSLSSLGLGIF